MMNTMVMNPRKLLSNFHARPISQLCKIAAQPAHLLIFSNLYRKDMEQRTKELIERLRSLETREEVESTIIDEVSRCKSSLKNKNYKFNTENRTDELIRGQGIQGRDVGETRYLEEIVYVKEGINGGWVDKINERTRFKKICDEVEEILFKFD